MRECPTIKLGKSPNVRSDSPTYKAKCLPSLVAGFALIANATPAYATLGAGLASIDSDRQAMRGDLRVGQSQGYTDYVLELPHGIRVNEFVNAEGVVFEVAWSGKGRRPDMHELLGEYFDYLNVPVAHARSRSRILDVALPQIAIQSHGFGRFFKGIAYLPEQLPASLTGPVPVPRGKE
jgi:hypothetical protein